MSGGQERLADYLAHIIEAIDRIGRYTGALDEASFLEDLLVQDANDVDHFLVSFRAARCGPAESPLNTCFLAFPAPAIGYTKRSRNLV